MIFRLYIMAGAGLSQTYQFSRFNRETHDFLCFLTISRLSPQISRFSELMKSSKSATSSCNKAHSSKETSHFISALIMRNVPVLLITARDCPGTARDCPGTARDCPGKHNVIYYMVRQCALVLNH
jgi:hypothetical protein